MVRVGRAVVVGALVVAVCSCEGRPATDGSAQLAKPSTRSGVLRVAMNITGSSNTGHVVLSGLIRDSGRVAFATSTGKPSDTGEFLLLVLHKGTILLNAEHMKQYILVDHHDGSDRGFVKGHVFVTNGTRQYAGMTGVMQVLQRVLDCYSRHNRFPICAKSPPGRLLAVNRIDASGNVTLQS
jgi:hypothetical protein